jgi:hypothetical protein
MDYRLHLNYLKSNLILEDETPVEENPEAEEAYVGDEATATSTETNSGNSDARKRDALKIIKEKVGGDFKRESRLSSFEGIAKGMDLLELSEIEENDETIKQIFKHLMSQENIDFTEKFIRNQKGRTKAIGSKLQKDGDKISDFEFKKDVNIMMKVIERVLKLNTLIRVNKAAVDEKLESRVSKIITNSETAIAQKVKAIQQEGIQELEAAIELEDPIEVGERVKQVEQVYVDLGLKDLIKELVSEIRGGLKNAAQEEKKEEKKNPEETKKKQSITKKKIVINRLIDALRLAILPELSGDEVKNGGGYYALYQALKNKNGVFMDDVLKSKVFKDQQEELSAFTAKASESGDESAQLAYLNGSKEWIKSYIVSELDGQIESQRDIEKLLSEVERLAEEKEKEIRNYYTAKDFNLGQFKGLQIKPEIYLPLCLSRSRSEAECKIKLPVSYKDRVDESPLKKFYLAGSAIMGGLFGNIPDTSDKAFAQAMAQRNQAIINGVSSIISGTLGIFSKQASRDYEEGLSNIKKKVKDTFSKPEKGTVREDMLGAPIQPMTEPGQLLQTPDSIPSGMDTFALLGPGGTGKKPSKKKKKPMKVLPKKGGVMSFNDFLKRSKNIK